MVIVLCIFVKKAGEKTLYGELILKYKEGVEMCARINFPRIY
jgi:hypothetical protein